MLWSTLCKFPVEVIAVHIMAMLALKEFATLETALVCRVSDPWRIGLKMRVPLELDDCTKQNLFVLTWALTRGLHIKGLNISGNDYSSRKDDAAILDLGNRYSEYVSDVSLRVLKTKEHIPTKELLAKCLCLIIHESLSTELIDAFFKHAVHMRGVELGNGNGDLISEIVIPSFGLQSISINASPLSNDIVSAIASIHGKDLDNASCNRNIDETTVDTHSYRCLFQASFSNN